MKLINCAFLNNDIVDMILSIDLESVEKVADLYGYDVNSIIVIDNFNKLPIPSEGCVLKYNRDTKTFSEIEYDKSENETQLDRIERLVQTNADLQSFYDDVIEEAGL